MNIQPITPEILRLSKPLADSPWPEPSSLAGSLPTVKKLDPAWLPNPLREWLQDTSRRMQCPSDFLAVASVVVYSSIIGARCAVAPKAEDKSWKVVPNLWGGIVGGPGSMKTPALNASLAALHRLERAAAQIHEGQMARFKTDEFMAKMQIDACKEELRTLTKNAAKAKLTNAEQQKHDQLKAQLHALTSGPLEPTCKRFLTNDATVEKLVELLRTNPAGLLIHRDELVGQLSMWDKPDRQSDRAFFLEGWAGSSPYKVDRIGRGTVQADNVCISFLGGIQPDMLRGYLLDAATSGHGNDGLIQRFQLLVWPDDSAKTFQIIDEVDDKTFEDRLHAIATTLADCDYEKLGASRKAGYPRPLFNFTPGAQVHFFYWWRRLERKVKDHNEPVLIREHLAKFRSLVPSLALIFHLIEVADGAPPGPVTMNSVRNAIAFADYLESHAHRVYGMHANAAITAASSLASRLVDGTLNDGFSTRDVYRKKWEHLASTKATDAALKELEDANWIRKIPRKKGSPGRPESQAYLINPAVKTAKQLH